LSKLQFEFELRDKVSGKARSMRVSLEDLGEGLKGVGKESEKAEKGAEGFLTKLHHGLGLAKEAFHVAEKIADIGIEFGKAAIEAASFKETALVSLTTVMGSAGDAGDALRQAVHLASLLPIETKDAMEATTKLALAGFDKSQIKPITLAASDVLTFNPGRGAEAMHLFLRQIAEIRQAGLGNRHLLALSQETNIDESKILENLGCDVRGARREEAQEDDQPGPHRQGGRRHRHPPGGGREGGRQARHHLQQAQRDGRGHVSARSRAASSS
jgi:hypothetical protein